jgi:hypothetical protein
VSTNLGKSAICIRAAIGISTFVVTAMLTLPAQAYDEGPVTGGGSITGKVTFNGTVPTRKIIPTKDVEVCGEPREEALMRVGPDKAVERAVVYLVDVAKGKPWPAGGKTPELDQVKCAFSPDVQVIRAGALDVINSDPILHNTHGYYDKRTAFNLALPNQGQHIPTELKRAGVVRIDCDAHGWMEGWIYVVDNPYYAVTGVDGKFTIPDVPAGNYMLVAVQPFTGPMQQPVVVAAGKPTDLSIELKKK